VAHACSPIVMIIITFWNDAISLRIFLENILPYANDHIGKYFWLRWLGKRSASIAGSIREHYFCVQYKNLEYSARIEMHGRGFHRFQVLQKGQRDSKPSRHWRRAQALEFELYVFYGASTLEHDFVWPWLWERQVFQAHHSHYSKFSRTVNMSNGELRHCDHLVSLKFL